MRSIVLVGLAPFVLLACGKDDPVAPTASIISPEDGAEYYADQKILFEGLITDDAQSPHELTVVWKAILMENWIGRMNPTQRVIFLVTVSLQRASMPSV